MSLSLEQARSLTDRRNAAMEAGDVDAFLALWAGDCSVEGPEHLLTGKDELRAQLDAAFSAMRVAGMRTRSLAVSGDALYYEFAIVWEVRATGDRMLFTGMTYHCVDAQGRLRICREYFDPPGKPRRSAAESPEIAALLAT
jgi:ketosteroid isomerase-like protein